MLQGTIEERTKRLRVVEESYALAMQTALIWDWDVRTNEVFISPGFAEALGYDHDSFNAIIAERQLFGFVLEDDAPALRQAIIKHLKAPEQDLSVEARFVSSAGLPRWYYLQGHCLRDASGRAQRSVGMLTDVTERKELEASLMVSQRLEAIGQLTGGLAHDFNNLLTVIQGNAELLEVTSDADREITTEIIQAARRGAELTHQLLSFARKQTLIPRNVDLVELIGRMSNTILRALGGSIVVSSQVPADLWHVYADAAQIEAALLNTSLNARDAMPGGGTLTIACRNLVLTSETARHSGLSLDAGAYVEIAITDTGCGMPREILAKAFEPFFTTKDVGKGSGLGLSMVHGFCRQSGGDARVTSIPGKGTNIFLYLPAAEGDILLPGDRGVKMPEAGKGELVHILEDNPQVQKTLVRVVQSLGYKVTTSSSAREAMEVVTRDPRPDVVLADIIVPGGQSGVDFAEMLQKEQPSAKIILMSGYPNFEQERMEAKGLHWPMLSKPLDKSALADAFRTALSGDTA